MMNKWHCGRFTFDFPLLMGVVNVTPDSFSDGGQFSSTAAAVAQGLKLAAEGAGIIDIGGESTRPGAAPVPEEEEKKRILPVIEQLAAAGIAVSADTMKPVVMRAALECGAAVLNDVRGFSDEESSAIAASSDCGVVIMHMQGKPQTMQASPQYDDVVAEVGDYLRGRAAKLQRAGVAARRICLDPGIGFGKTLEHNTALLRHLPEISGDYPLLAGVSRKSLLAALCGGRDDELRDIRSAAAAAVLSLQGAHVLRVHHAAATRDALAIASALARK